MLDWIADPAIWASLVTLTVMEIVLGIDNIVFISILVGKLPAHQQAGAYRVGLGLAMVMRILLLLSISWIMSLTAPLFTIPFMGNEVSGRDLVLIVGGLFLVAKSTHEIHDKLEGHEGGRSERVAASYGAVLAQIMALDLVFSLDSVITAIGMTNNLPVMVTAIVIAVLTMMVASGPLSRFVNTHPTIKVLALAFLLLVGVVLVGDGLDFHVPKGYIYFAMAFSVGVEMINLRVRERNLARRRLPSTEDSTGI